MSRRKTYEQLYRAFRWTLPSRYNIGVDVCDKWAAVEPGRLAILHKRPGGAVGRVSYGELREASNRLANGLRAAGVVPGDRVAVLLPQSPEIVIAHAGAAKLGALSLPLASLFGPDALEYRLADSAAKAIVLDAAGWPSCARSATACRTSLSSSPWTGRTAKPSVFVRPCRVRPPIPPPSTPRPTIRR